MDTKKIKEFVKLNQRKKDLESEAKSVGAEMRKLETELLEQFAEDGVSNINLDGVTVYTHSQLWAGAKDGDYERACEALREEGLGDYVQERFNANSISAWVREYVRELQEEKPDLDTEDASTWLPGRLKDTISVAEKFGLRMRKS